MTQLNTTVAETVRTIVGKYGKLAADAATLSETSDLYAAGLTSHASVTVMLAVEDEWDVEFPQHLLKKSTFGSIGAIVAALAELGVTG